MCPDMSLDMSIPQFPNFFGHHDVSEKFESLEIKYHKRIETLVRSRQAIRACLWVRIT